MAAIMWYSAVQMRRTLWATAWNSYITFDITFDYLEFGNTKMLIMTCEKYRLYEWFATCCNMLCRNNTRAKYSMAPGHLDLNTAELEKRKGCVDVETSFYSVLYCRKEPGLDIADFRLKTHSTSAMFSSPAHKIISPLHLGICYS